MSHAVVTVLVIVFDVFLVVRAGPYLLDRLAYVVSGDPSGEAKPFAAADWAIASCVDLYVRGEIEIDELEARVEQVLRTTGDPWITVGRNFVVITNKVRSPSKAVLARAEALAREQAGNGGNGGSGFAIIRTMD